MKWRGGAMADGQSAKVRAGHVMGLIMSMPRSCVSSLCVLALAWAMALGVQGSAAQPASFAKIADVPLGERTSRFDYLSLDPVTGRLFMSEMGSAKLLVFDIARQALIAQLANFPKVTGVLAVPELHKVFASVPGGGIGGSMSVAISMAGLSKGSGQVAVLDAQSLQEIARLPGGVFPDGIAYDADDGRIFVSDELGDGVTVIDAHSNKVLARIKTDGEVGNVQYDPITRRIYAPIQTRNAMSVIDPARLKLESQFALPGGEHPHGLRLAHGAAIGYVACDGNDRLLVVDLQARKVTANLPVAHDPDVLADDAGLKRLYVAGEGGMLSVFDVTAPDAPVKLAEFQAGPQAHSLAVDPATHRLYLPLHDVDGKAVLRILAPR
jgi:YVTN family beta-propeller protein